MHGGHLPSGRPVVHKRVINEIDLSVHDSGIGFDPEEIVPKAGALNRCAELFASKRN